MVWFPWQLCGWLIALLGAPLLAALFADRAKGRRRCPKCWYDMCGVPATIQAISHRPTFLCPECAHTARSERALLKTRRRLKLLPLTILVFAVGYLVWSVPRYRHEGPIGLVPTTYMILATPFPELNESTHRSRHYRKLQETLHSRIDDARDSETPPLYWWHKHLWDASLKARAAFPSYHYESNQRITVGCYDVAAVLDRRFVSSCCCCCHGEAQSPIRCACVHGWTDNFYDLAEALCYNIQPECWSQNGGDQPHAEVVASRLYVVASSSVQAQTAQLLDALRLAKAMGYADLRLAGKQLRIYRVRNVDNDWRYNAELTADALYDEFNPAFSMLDTPLDSSFRTVGSLLVVTGPNHLQAEVPFAILQLEAFFEVKN